MIKDNEIITKNDRLNSHLNYQQTKFKIPEQQNLKYNSSFPQEPTNYNIYENERTDHYTIFQKVGYSVSQDLKQQEQQRIIKESLVSTEIQSVQKLTSRQSQQFSFIPRGQSIEFINNNDKLINKPESPYNSQNIRNIYHNYEKSSEYKNENLLNEINDHTSNPFNSISLSNKKISKNYNPILLIDKFKQIRRCFQMIRALFRLKMLYNLKKSTWNLQMNIFKSNQKILKYNESITLIKIKQWTQMVYAKMISIIQYQNLEKQKLNFIENPEIMTSVEIDQAIIFIQNNFTFTMSNLLMMITGENLLKELSLQMYQDQYLEYRKQFSKFVSLRTNYISYYYQKLNQQEKQLVFTEFIIIHNLIPNLIKLTYSLESLKCNISNIKFLIKCMISLFQYFFLLQFSNYPKIQIKNENIKYSQYHLGNNGSQFILIQNQQLKSDNLIDGVYTEEQMQLILNKKSWLEQNKKKMNIVSYNLAILV
ncbi:unnamed protein product [Paramecium primaurelia]|uniref:Uncharacterized protein n=1 Tax=Paramecium primaurelia TaxID=5886 RepID=A0A8S1N1S8_PARPR|nr:unnamed protein product [Paramecium primaurelia]